MKVKAFAIILALSSLSAMAQEGEEYQKFRVGGYGEVLASFMGYGTSRFNGTANGNTYENRNRISIPRFVVAGDYRFNKHWNLGAEIEFEAGGVGMETEIEASENGE